MADNIGKGKSPQLEDPGEGADTGHGEKIELKLRGDFEMAHLPVWKDSAARRGSEYQFLKDVPLNLRCLRWWLKTVAEFVEVTKFEVPNHDKVRGYAQDTWRGTWKMKAMLQFQAVAHATGIMHPPRRHGSQPSEQSKQPEQAPVGDPKPSGENRVEVPLGGEQLSGDLYVLDQPSGGKLPSPEKQRADPLGRKKPATTSAGKQLELPEHGKQVAGEKKRSLRPVLALPAVSRGVMHRPATAIKRHQKKKRMSTAGEHGGETSKHPTADWCPDCKLRYKPPGWGTTSDAPHTVPKPTSTNVVIDLSESTTPKNSGSISWPSTERPMPMDKDDEDDFVEYESKAEREAKKPAK